MSLWGGRFTASLDERMRLFNDSLPFDRRLYAADIRGSLAYAAAISKLGLITPEERDQLQSGLRQVLGEFEENTFQPRREDEDIHTAVERRLMELVGSVAGKLHTGRSRNDQVATDLRLYMVGVLEHLEQDLINLQTAIVDKAEANLDVVMPGYTHVQQAQPLLFSHWLLSFFWKLQRDRERLSGVVERTAVLPLGSGALAGHPFGLDRDWLAQELGLWGVTENSLDAVSDRDFVVEFLSWAALVQVHLSGLAEDLIWWSSHEFGFVQLDDRFSTGSSLMPQKRNPDSMELMRGKSGRMVGHLVGLLTVLKGLPSGYNKDLQEDKEGLFDAADTLGLELPIAADVIRTLRLNPERMEQAMDDSMLATDLADYLVRKGVAFRQAHHLVGEAVKLAEARQCGLSDIALGDYQDLDPRFGDDLYNVFDYGQSLERRSVKGGTAPEAVARQIGRARELMGRSQREEL